VPSDDARLLKGNEACVRAALLASCRSFYGYPITPASEIAEEEVFRDRETRLSALRALGVGWVLGACEACPEARTA
jgi:TPP-dependent indolepyruvate ferredoxin oxidoreductase alpha subunit